MDKDIVHITCYGKEEDTPRDKAIEFYTLAVASCDPNSSECGRYVKILTGLRAGDKVVSD